jgi:hypothetical protein
LPRIPQLDPARLLQVSDRSVRSAKVIRDRGAPELIAKVEKGQVTVSLAAEIATLPLPEQCDFINQ